MGASGCVFITAEATEFLSSDAGMAEARRLLAEGAPPDAFIEMLNDVLDDQSRELLRLEFEELPANTVTSIMMSWAVAASSGRRFTLASAPPPRPLEFARQRRVDVLLSHDEDGVTVTVSHVPGRHALWYREHAIA